MGGARHDARRDSAAAARTGEAHGDRARRLRHQSTTHDATYLVLAETLEAPLVTCDRTLAGIGHRADVALIPPAR